MIVAFVFCRLFLPDSPSVAVLGPLVYEAIKKYPDGTKEELTRAFQCVCGSNFVLKKPLILFPCKARYIYRLKFRHYSALIILVFSDAWHWLLVAVVPDMNK